MYKALVTELSDADTLERSIAVHTQLSSETIMSARAALIHIYTNEG